MRRMPYLSRRNIFFTLLLILVVSRYLFSPEPATKHLDTGNEGSNAVIIEAFNKQQRNVQLTGSGTIVKILADDLKGSRHQRLIVRVAQSHTVLLAHNIDLAPRIPNPEKGDTIEFYGEYEWNPQGGVIHWTHHDPQGRHVAGWLRHNNEIYQ